MTHPSPDLPRTFWQAMWRGARGKCPRCDGARLFRKFQKPVDSCPSCGQDWSFQQADDFPAYVAIIVTGHLLAPLMIALSLDFELTPLGMAAVLVPLAVALMIGLLQPSKGAIIAVQWWHGLHGFRRERREDAGGSNAA